MLSDSIPRLNLAHLPTPLQRLSRLSESAGGPEIYIKRDDCAGLALGGNKIRKLEYLLADAKSCGATTVITAGGMQSNHARLTAAAACQVGMSCELVLERPASIPTRAFAQSGNQLLNRWLDAKVHLIDSGQEPGPPQPLRRRLPATEFRRFQRELVRSGGASGGFKYRQAL